MRKLLLWIVVLSAIGWALTRPTTLEPDRLPARAPNPVNGERVFHASGCGSCHGEDLSGGVEFHTAFGTFRAPNITPDPEAGIGGWSDLDLANAIGSLRRARRLLPALARAGAGTAEVILGMIQMIAMVSAKWLKRSRRL